MEHIDKKLGKQTTFFLPDEIRREIHARDMTINGAFLAGWKAIQNQVKYAARIEELEEDNRDMMKNIRSMQRMMTDLHAKLEEGKNVQHR